jgi:hypothetical protein
MRNDDASFSPCRLEIGLADELLLKVAIEYIIADGFVED